MRLKIFFFLSSGTEVSNQCIQEETLIDDDAVSLPIDLDVTHDENVAGEEFGLPVGEGGGVLSPLSGAYLLIILAEPMSNQHKEKMLHKLRQGLLTIFIIEKKSIQILSAKLKLVDFFCSRIKKVVQLEKKSYRIID